MRTDTGEIISEQEAKDLRRLHGDHIAIPMEVEPTPKQARLRKVGRNELCPCGSGRKFKRCHLIKNRIAEGRARMQAELSSGG
jgi:hypothetical protein